MLQSQTVAQASGGYGPSDPTVAHFIAMAHAAPRLSREEEAALLERIYVRGDEAAKSELLASHLRHVVSIAMKYRRYGLPLSDLFAEGNFGLVRALEKFEPARGFR